MPTFRVRPGPRAGFTLIEILIAITIMGLMLAIALPRVRDNATRGDVQGARGELTNLYQRARVTALQQRKTATLQVSGNMAWVAIPLGAGTDTVGAVVDLAGRYGVAAAASQLVRVSPTGLVNAGTPITMIVSKGYHADTLTISGYGKIQ